MVHQLVLDIRRCMTSSLIQAGPYFWIIGEAPALLDAGMKGYLKTPRHGCCIHGFSIDIWGFVTVRRELGSS
jgi:hypothetical protein